MDKGLQWTTNSDQPVFISKRGCIWDGAELPDGMDTNASNRSSDDIEAAICPAEHILSRG